MITIKYLPRRFSKEKILEQQIEHVPGRTYIYYLNRMKHLPGKFKKRQYTIIEDGEVVTNLRKKPKPTATILVTPRIEWFVVIFVVKAIWAYALAHPFIFWATVIMMSYSVYSSMAMKRRLKNFGTSGAGIDESSPTYGWDGIQQTCSVGTPIGLVYGEHRVGGNVINEYLTNDGDNVYLNTLTCLGEGEVESISGGQIDKNPVENYSDIQSSFRYGTNDQAVIPNFEELHNLRPLSVSLLKNTPYTVTTEDDDVDSFQLYFLLQNGIYEQQTDGSMIAWAVTYNVQIKLHADASWTDLGNTTINYKSRTTVRRTYTKTGLTPGQYDIKITKVSDDSDETHQGDMTLQYLDEVKCEDLQYVNRVLVATRIKANEQLSSNAPNITWLVKGRKIKTFNVRNGSDELVPYDDYYYDPVAEKFKLFEDDTELVWEEDFTTAYSANPIWCLQDLTTHTRYGLGRYIEEENVDADRMLEQALYCERKTSDGKGGYEKLFRLDCVIDSANKALDLITQLTVTCNAFPTYSSGAVSFTIDKPAPIPTQEFGMANIVKNSFSESMKSYMDTPTVVHVTFNDRDNNYEQDTITVQDEEALQAGSPERPATIRVFCTRMSQAIRAGRYCLWVGKYVNRSVSIKTGMDAILCRAGERIEVSHDVPQWGYSGMVKTGSTTTLVKLNRTVQIESGKTYEIQVRYGADKIESRVVTDGPGQYTEVNVGTAFTAAPSAGDIFSFGTENLVSKPFRVMSIERTGENEGMITAIEYDERVYQENPIELPTNNYSALSYSVPNVENLRLTERLVKLADGTIQDCIDVWFTKPQLTFGSTLSYQKSKVYISEDAGASWIYKGETYSDSFSIQDGIYDGQTYKVAVVSCSGNGRTQPISTSPQSSIEVIGKSANPSDVTWFRVRQSRDKLTMRNSAVTDVDLYGYEIRQGASWETGQLVVTGLLQTTYISYNMKLGTGQPFWIKAVDTSGNYSTNATEALITVDVIPFTNIIKEYQGETAWAGTLDDLEVVDDALQVVTGELFGTYTTPVRDNGYVAPFKIGTDIAVVDATSADATWDDEPADATWGDLLDTDRWSGPEAIGAIGIEIRTSEDNITWTDWEDWQAGDYKCRYFQLRFTLTRADLATILRFVSAYYYSDLPDIDERGDGEVTVAADGADVTLTKEFHEDPSAAVTILSGTGIYYRIEDLSTTGFTVKLYDNTHTLTTGTFRVHVHGV